MNPTEIIRPGMRARRAAQALTPKQMGNLDQPPEDPRVRQNEITRKAQIIEAEFHDLIADKEGRGACVGCGGLFKHSDLHPASGHPEADPICSTCLEHELLVRAVKNYCGEYGADGSQEIYQWFKEFRTPRPKTGDAMPSTTKRAKSKRVLCVLNPHAPSTDWKGRTVGERVRDCLMMLYCHGFATDGEYQAIDQRITDWMAQNKPRRKQAPKMAPIVDHRPIVLDDKLCCRQCRASYLITASGMICDCPGMRRRNQPFSILKATFPNQISESPADNLTRGVP